MEYRRLGKSGLQVSELSFGSWVTFGNQIDTSVAEKCMKKAYDSGINFFDNAEAYANGNSEIVMGKILHEQAWGRDTFVVSSKVFWGGNLPNQKGLSRKHVIEACHAALKRLQVDYLDLYFCHRPDINTPVEETVRAMTDLITQGKVLYWGTSEWSAQEIMEAYSVARREHLVPPTMEQPQYNMFHRQKIDSDYLKLYQEIGLGTTIWSPLASGLLTGKYNEGIVPTDSRANLEGMEWLKERLTNEDAKAKIPTIKKLTQMAADLDTSLIRLAIAWCLKNPNVSTVILGASKLVQLEDNLKAQEVVAKLTPDVMEEIEKILKNKPKREVF
ncbi:MAG: voltage-dependent potassium channel subunit beta [Bacteroidetes bacterium]|nr:MAG: voltage-dependent potassium channel subunit beta [Bacteroidota bacterium]